MIRLPRAKPGEAITAERWNALLDAIEQALRITGTGLLQVHQDRTGTHLSLGAERKLLHVITNEDYTATDTAFIPAGPISASVYDGPPTEEGVDTGVDIDLWIWPLRVGEILEGTYMNAWFENGYFWGVNRSCP